MGTRLYCGNIPFSATQEDLRAFFAPVELVDVKICTDRETARPRGFAFVELKNEADKDAALARDNIEMGGRAVLVNLAREREPRGSAGGGRRNERNGREDNRTYDRAWRD